jgi:NTP pyrophosphatase (non-canonical NTP hydrolase)
MQMKLDWESLRQEILQFRNDRDWEPFHTPKNLAAAIAIEASELQECFLWKTDSEIADLLSDPIQRRKAEMEVADVFIYLILLVDKMGMSVQESVRTKIKLNDRKYPVQKAKGNAKKYSELK